MEKDGFWTKSHFCVFTILFWFSDTDLNIWYMIPIEQCHRFIDYNLNEIDWSRIELCTEKYTKYIYIAFIFTRDNYFFLWISYLIRSNDFKPEYHINLAQNGYIPEK